MAGFQHLGQARVGAVAGAIVVAQGNVAALHGQQGVDVAAAGIELHAATLGQGEHEAAGRVGSHEAADRAVHRQRGAVFKHQASGQVCLVHAQVERASTIAEAASLDGVGARLQRGHKACVQLVAAVVVFHADAVAAELHARIELARFHVDGVQARLGDLQGVGLVAAAQPIGDALAGGERLAVIGDDRLDRQLERAEGAGIGAADGHHVRTGLVGAHAQCAVALFAGFGTAHQRVAVEHRQRAVEGAFQLQRNRLAGGQLQREQLAAGAVGIVDRGGGGDFTGNVGVESQGAGSRGGVSGNVHGGGDGQGQQSCCKSLHFDLP
ncbi:hypothetical protein D3C71_1047730 [compost metagenome]